MNSDLNSLLSLRAWKKQSYFTHRKIKITIKYSGKPRPGGEWLLESGIGKQRIEKIK